MKKMDTNLKRMTRANSLRTAVAIVFVIFAMLQQTEGETILKSTASVADTHGNGRMRSTDPLFFFVPDERWRDVLHTNPQLYDLSYRPDGLAVTIHAAAKATVLRLVAPRFLNEAALGSVTRITTDVELVQGDADTTVLLSIVDPGKHDAAAPRGDVLTTGNNHLAWSASNAAEDGLPVNSDPGHASPRFNGYEVRVPASAGNTILVFHKAVIEAWQPTVRAFDIDTDRKRFLWSPGETAHLVLKVKNLAGVASSQTFGFTLSNDLDHELWSRPVSVAIPAQSTAEARVDVPTTTLAQGVYILRWTDPTANPALRGQALLTIADAATPAKAKDGAFLYGMDIGASWEETNVVDWADWCGVDVVRNCARDQIWKDRDMRELINAYTYLTQRHFRCTVLISPMTPWDADREKFAAIMAEQTAHAAEIAETLNGHPVTMYEVGNEPDIIHFFPGPPADWVNLYVSMRDAIKNVDPNVMVFSAGMPFGGMANAEQRAKDIIKLMPAGKTDAWAYHGHGDGSKAERVAFERIKHTAEAVNKGGKPYYETESGTTSTEPLSWRAQARTLVEKLVYAQSTHEIPVFMWFGLHPRWVWGILETDRQAKPAALAHHVLVQYTRGMVASGPLDLHGATGEAYAFTPRDAGDDRCVVALWSNAGEFTRSVALGLLATDVKISDMFGNTRPATVDADGVVDLAVTRDPIYLLAKRPSRAAAVTILQPALDVPNVLSVAPGGSASVDAIIHNRLTTPLHATLSVVASGAAPVLEGATKVMLEPSATGTFSVRFPTADRPPAWFPRVWSVFAPVSGEVDMAGFSAIPATLMVDGQVIESQTSIPKDGNMNLASLGGGYGEKKQALCFAKVHVDADMDTQMGASADYWMECFVNGKSVCSTLATGNQGPTQSIAHVFPVHLTKGDNLLAVRVLSGSGGWRLLAGGPEMITAAQNAKSDIVDGLIVQLADGPRIIARDTVKVTVMPAVERYDSKTLWPTLAPDFTVTVIDNPHMKQPDATKWYHGPADCSGTVWVRVSPDALLITIAVRDDIDMPGDGVLVRLAAGDHLSRRTEYRSAKKQLVRQRDAQHAVTWYYLTVPRKELAVSPHQPMACDVIIDDDDWGVLKQQAGTGAGDNPASWYQTYLAE